MRDSVRAWLGAQTWPDVRPEITDETNTYVHPYGFVVIRLSHWQNDTWNARLHLWPSPGQVGPLAQPGVDDFLIHSHGWDLVSRTLIGRVEQSIYTVDQLGGGDRSEHALYRVEHSDYLVGSSVLMRERGAVSVASDRVSVVGSDDLPFVVPSGTYHSTRGAEKTDWSVTLALTQQATGNPSHVVGPRDAPDRLTFRRAAPGKLDRELRGIDDAYAAFGGDRWAAFVFIQRAGRVLMVRSYRYPDRWQPVGGQSQPRDTDPLATALREVNEETGLRLQASSLRPLGQRPRDKGAGIVHAWSYQVTGDVAVRVPEDEIAEHQWMDVEELSAAGVWRATRAFLSRMKSEGILSG